MPPERKAATVTALTTMAIEMAEAGIRHRHPGESYESHRRRLAILLLGPDLAARALREPPDAP